MKIAIAGAFGFIGQHLIQHLLAETEHDIVAISRSPRDSVDPRILSVTADLYSLKETTNALVGCDVAIYLVHSMLAGSRLSQGKFRDFDFILADNFGRSALANGVKRVIYVGGMIPSDKSLSIHLQSRLEVEEVLRSYAIPLTVFRCGLVIGPKASSFSIIVRLTARLPMMVLPQWMRTLSNPIYVGDLVKLISTSIKSPSVGYRIIDAGMDESVSYRDIVVETAKVIGKSPLLIDVPYVSPHLSKLWVRIVSGAPKALVYPLIDSVRHRMLKSNSREIPKSWGVRICGLAEAIEKTFKIPFEFKLPRLGTAIRDLNEVRSVQRVPLPAGKNAEWIAGRYVEWISPVLVPLLKVVKINGACEYRLRFFNVKLLGLVRDNLISKDDRQLFWVTDGMLVAEGNVGRLEFRESHDKKFLIIALHNYRPALTWNIYRYTQAIIHSFVMKQFSRMIELDSHP